MSKKLETTIGKINKVFNQAEDLGFTLKKSKIARGSSNSNDSYKNYKKEVVKFTRKYHERFGTADVTKFREDKVRQLIEEDVDDYFSGNLNKAYTIHKVLNALEFFQRASEETDVFVNKKTNEQGIRFINAKAYKKELVNDNVIRRSDISSSKKAKEDEAVKVLSNVKKDGYRTENRLKTIDICTFALMTGSRISAALKIEKDDIDFVNNKLTFKNDKGQKTRTINIDNKTKEFLRSVVSKSSENRLFQYYKKNGDKLSDKKSRDLINDTLRNSTKEFSVEKEVTYKDRTGNKQTTIVKQNFTYHSFRKAYAHNQMMNYIHTIQKDSRAAILNDLYERESKEVIDEKIQIMTEKVNQHKENKETYRNLNDLEICIFAVSVDLGHYRADVVSQFYINKKDYTQYFK